MVSLHRRFFELWRVFGVGALLTGCATDPGPPTADGHSVQEQTATLAHVPASGSVSATATFPHGGEIAEAEVVALALWNNPDFRASLAELGIAQAEVIAARSLRNPTLSLLDPVGPGLLEGTLAIPIDLLRRPARIEAATFQLEKTTQSLVHDGLRLARDVHRQLANLELAEARARLLEVDADGAHRLAELAQHRAEVGRGSPLDTLTARGQAAAAAIALEQGRQDARTASIALAALVGVPVGPVRLAPARPQTLPDAEELKRLAHASRPDLVAAEMAVESAKRAGDALGLELWRPGVIVDLGREPGESLQVSGGASIDLPLFDQAQAAKARARASYEQAVARRAGLEPKIDQEIETALAALGASATTLHQLEETLLPVLEKRLEAAEHAVSVGRANLLEAVLARRELVAAQLQQVEAVAAHRRATADLNFSVGRELFVPSPERME